MWKIVVGLLAIALIGALAEEEAVLTLTDQNFDETLANNDHMMVEFYAPWCGHCKALAPEYESAAQELKEDGISLAKVDCTEYRDLCELFGVQGFPTVKWFAHQQPVDYSGARSADAIVNFCRNRVGPAAEEVNADALEEFKAKSDVTVLAFFADGESSEYGAFSAFADLLRDDFAFGYSFDASLAESLGAAVPSAVVFRSFDEPATTDNFEELGEFVVNESFPPVAEISGANYQKYVERGLPFVWLFVDGEEFSGEEYGATIAAAQEIAGDFKNKASIVYLDGAVFEQFRESLGVAGDLPRVLVQDVDTDLKFVYEGEVSAAGLKGYTEKVLAGEATPFLKSEPVPESSDDPVTVIVGSTFDEIVFDESKNVLVEFYAPWCGHCKKLVPIYDELGQNFQDNENVVIAKVDATANDTPYPVSGFPTLVYFGAGSKDTPEEYSGGRDLESLVDFINGKISGESAHDEL